MMENTHLQSSTRYLRETLDMVILLTCSVSPAALPRPKADRVKELRFSPRTAVNDLDVKLRNLRRMLDEGDR